MRILHVAHGWPPAGGGAERYAAQVAAAQQALGCAVSVFAPGAPGWVASAPARGFEASFSNAAMEASFRARLAASPVDIVHIHHLTGLSLQLPTIAQEAGARVVLTLHDYWMACARGQMVDERGDSCPGPTVDRCSRCLAAPLWAPAAPVLARHLPLRRGPVRRRNVAVTHAFGAVDLLLSPSPHLAPRMGVRAELCDLPSDVAVTDRGGGGAVRFLFVGALIATKAPHLAIDAFGRLPAGAGSLDLVGPALPWNGRFDYADSVLALARATPAVRYRGVLDPVPWSEGDVLVFPSTWDENHPLVLAEAQSAGLRIIASDVPGARHVAPLATFVAPRSVPGLVAAMGAAVRRGRVRSPSRQAESTHTHARWLLDRYAMLAPGV